MEDTAIGARLDHWSLDDLGLDRVEIGRLRLPDEVFLLLAGASFVEAASNLYTRNLVEHFRGDDEVCDWLTARWEPEELQHGRALRAYVARAWPAFDWQRGFEAFLADYSRICTTEELEPSRCLEMAARCVVEMGTATYYRSIRVFAEEPVLARLARFIEQDEVRHYKHFLRYFHKYNAIEPAGRMAVFGALVRRLVEMRRSDTECGAWHAFHTRHPGSSRSGSDYRGAVARGRALLRRHSPARMSIRMFLKPLALSRAMSRLTYPAARLAQDMIMR